MLLKLLAYTGLWLLAEGCGRGANKPYKQKPLFDILGFNFIARTQGPGESKKSIACQVYTQERDIYEEQQCPDGYFCSDTATEMQYMGKDVLVHYCLPNITSSQLVTKQACRMMKGQDVILDLQCPENMLCEAGPLHVQLVSGGDLTFWFCNQPQNQADILRDVLLVKSCNLQMGSGQVLKETTCDVGHSCNLGPVTVNSSGMELDAYFCTPVGSIRFYWTTILSFNQAKSKPDKVNKIEDDDTKVTVSGNPKFDQDKWTNNGKSSEKDKRLFTDKPEDMKTNRDLTSKPTVTSIAHKMDIVYAEETTIEATYTDRIEHKSGVYDASQQPTVSGLPDVSSTSPESLQTKPSSHKDIMTMPSEGQVTTFSGHGEVSDVYPIANWSTLSGHEVNHSFTTPEFMNEVSGVSHKSEAVVGELVHVDNKETIPPFPDNQVSSDKLENVSNLHNKKTLDRNESSAENFSHLSPNRGNGKQTEKGSNANRNYFSFIKADDKELQERIDKQNEISRSRDEEREKALGKMPFFLTDDKTTSSNSDEEFPTANTPNVK